MDAYVEGYYGDESLEAHAHQMAGTTCLECHEAKIDEQVHEAMVWVSGDFATDDAACSRTSACVPDAKMCATSGCHDYNDVIAATENWGGREGVNPHDSHQGYELTAATATASTAVDHVLQHLPRLRGARGLGEPRVGRC